MRGLGYEESLNPKNWHPTHDMVLDEDGLVNVWKVDWGHHNGPECKRCGLWCYHCEFKRGDEECPDAAPAADGGGG